jgi:DnaK suppressor protein
MKTVLSPEYRPSEAEEFMNPLQLEYFRLRLLDWRVQLIEDSKGMLSNLQKESLL